MYNHGRNNIKSEVTTSCLDTYARNPLMLGLLIGVLAAVVQGLLISAGGPEAYGFCVACHTRDLVNDAVNSVAGTNLAIAAISQNAILPVLTVIGVLIGAFISAKFYREFRTKTGSAVYLYLVPSGRVVLHGICPVHGWLSVPYCTPDRVRRCHCIYRPPCNHCGCSDRNKNCHGKGGA